jgi:hypothetical protein
MTSSVVPGGRLELQVIILTCWSGENESIMTTAIIVAEIAVGATVRID